MHQQLFEKVDQYITGLFVETDPCLAAIERSIIENDIPSISISPTQGKLLHLLAKLCHAKNILELGTLAGYSTVWMARALPENGHLLTLESNEKHAAVAKENFIRCGLADRITIKTGNAIETLPALVGSKAGPFDMIFIDADKPPYTAYFQWALQVSRPGTLIIADNVIREGKVLDTGDHDERVMGVRRFNDYLSQCKQVTATIFQTVGAKEHDGMAMAIVK
ncbi:MAG: O-methyltransferase [Terrimonas sp.]|nr:O-methyltransferase [Terrimonas sp.]